nr:MAG TPA: Leucophaea maderae tachykinin-related peptide [Caudoviricetes sp.]
MGFQGLRHTKKSSGALDRQQHIWYYPDQQHPASLG